MVRFHSYGDPDVLVVDEMPVPVPAAGEVLVEVEAAGITLPIVRQVRGDASVALPAAPGGELAGRIVAVGENVSGWQEGQRVTGIAATGAYADFAVVAAPFLTAVPDEVSAEDALLLVRSGQVAAGVLRCSGLRAGETVLVTAAAGGVGHLAIQLAKAASAGTVIAAVGSMEKSEFLLGLGADRVVTYDDLPHADVILDSVGGDVQQSCIDALTPFGRLVSYSGRGATANVNELRMHARTIIGFSMAPYFKQRRKEYDENLSYLWRLKAAGAARPIIAKRLPLEKAAEAHRIVEARQNLGKIVLCPKLG